MKGKLKRERYHVETILIDPHSDLTYMHLQQQSKSDKTVQAKSAFEKYICSQGIQIKHYHADNGRFADNALLKSFNKEVQTLSLCVVNSHSEKMV